MVKKKPAAQAKTAENETVKVETKAAEKTTAAEKEAVKANLLQILKETYGMEEADFASAELELVPAGKARDCGLDRSMILAYGQDDRVCAFTSLFAMLDVEEVEKEVVKETAAAVEAPAKAEEKPAAKAAKTTRTTAKKTTTKKAAAPKKPAAAKKPAEKKAPAKAAKKEAEQEMILQFGGREIKEKDLYERIQQIWTEGYGKKAEELKSLKVYVKPEEFTAYYVINDDVTGSIDL